MLHLSASCKYYLHREPTDMRKGFDSLCGTVSSQLQMNALSGAVFIFINKNHNQVKLLLWEGDGFAVYYKRLEKGTYEVPVSTSRDKDISITHVVNSCDVDPPFLHVDPPGKRAIIVRA
jgi:transposase